jgi:hypothetical protein
VVLLLYCRCLLFATTAGAILLLVLH